MSELRKDPVLNRWVIIAPERGPRPYDYATAREVDAGSAGCPFCEGNERMTPPEVYGLRDAGEPNTPGWYVRVVPNKFPTLHAEGDLARTGDGLFEHMGGLGAHEIVIENPRHEVDLPFSPEEQIMRVLEACRRRVEDLRGDPRFRHITVFRNHGALAGATVGHPHSQVMALPIIPYLVREQLKGAAAHFTATGRCVFCDIVAQELAAGSRTIIQSPHFVALAPYASRFAAETVIYPRRHCHDMVQMNTEELVDLAGVLRHLLLAYYSGLGNPPYNLVCLTAPSLPPEGQDGLTEEALRRQYHWCIVIMPRLTTMAGFEWGTGVYINPVAPEEAAATLKKELVREAV